MVIYNHCAVSGNALPLQYGAMPYFCKSNQKKTVYKRMDMKKLVVGGMMIAASVGCMAQSLEKMQWFNEPEQWEIEGNSLLMNVTPQTD